jgi:hypothetical protein
MKMLFTTPALLHVAQKSPFENFKCKKRWKTLAIFFFWCTHISVVGCLAIALANILVAWLTPFNQYN